MYTRAFVPSHTQIKNVRCNGSGRAGEERGCQWEHVVSGVSVRTLSKAVPVMAYFNSHKLGALGMATLCEGCSLYKSFCKPTPN